MKDVCFSMTLFGSPNCDLWFSFAKRLSFFPLNHAGFVPATTATSFLFSVTFRFSLPDRPVRWVSTPSTRFFISFYSTSGRIRDTTDTKHSEAGLKKYKEKNKTDPKSWNHQPTTTSTTFQLVAQALEAGFEEGRKKQSDGTRWRLAMGGSWFSMHGGRTEATINNRNKKKRKGGADSRHNGRCGPDCARRVNRSTRASGLGLGRSEMGVWFLGCFFSKGEN